MRTKPQIRTKTILAASAVCVGALLAGAQPADGPRDSRLGLGGLRGDSMARALDLTEDQKAAFRELLEQQRPQIQELRDQMRENHEKLTAALESDNPEPAAVGQTVIQGQALRKQAEVQREQTNQALRALLTPEQRTKFDALNSLREHGPFGLLGPGFGPGRILPGGRGGRPPSAPEE